MTEIDNAVNALQKGEIVLYPTDTLYALGVDVGNRDALKKLYALKGREEGKQTSVLVSDMEMAEKYGVFSSKARALAEKFLPGPLTLVVPKKGKEDETIGIRIPDHEFSLELVKAFGGPITATSANVSGEESKTTVQEILEQFGDKSQEIDMVVDHGKMPGTPSTVAQVIDGNIVVLREGAIQKELLL
jgi:L-threonylcarbamoyladenylate synthase|tara:strand:- start:937 stop:1500 length:564 start_codon:yes stop_codon:yes gene_type:complete